MFWWLHNRTKVSKQNNSECIIIYAHTQGVEPLVTAQDRTGWSKSLLALCISWHGENHVFILQINWIKFLISCCNIFTLKIVQNVFCINFIIYTLASRCMMSLMKRSTERSGSCQYVYLNSQNHARINITQMSEENIDW